MSVGRKTDPPSEAPGKSYRMRILVRRSVLHRIIGADLSESKRFQDRLSRLLASHRQHTPGSHPLASNPFRLTILRLAFRLGLISSPTLTPKFALPGLSLRLLIDMRTFAFISWRVTGSVTLFRSRLRLCSVSEADLRDPGERKARDMVKSLTSNRVRAARSVVG